MIALWMIYAAIVSLLLAGAAAAAEYSLRIHKKPARWVWVGAMASSVVLTVVAYFNPSLLPAAKLSVPDDAGIVGGNSGPSEQAFVSAGSDLSWLESLDTALVIVWIGLSAVLLLLFAWTTFRLAREVRSCPPTVCDGKKVLVSPNIGPAVLGLIRTTVVLPTWALELNRDLRDLISLHEQEHVRAYDQQLLVAALGVLLVLPWNAGLWWAFRRLRLAVEADCDLRVLRQGINRRTYSTFLLEIERQTPRSRLPSLAFAKGESSLARRIHLMTWKPRGIVRNTAGAIGIAVVLGVLACETPVPNEPPPIEESVVAQIAANEDPLLIIDGVIVGPVGQSEIDLETLDIERIEVVKGAPAEALYGERAKNGIIQVYTHRGADSVAGRAMFEAQDYQMRLEGERITLQLSEPFPDSLVGGDPQRTFELQADQIQLRRQNDSMLVPLRPSVQFDTLEVVDLGSAKSLYRRGDRRVDTLEVVELGTVDTLYRRGSEFHVVPLLIRDTILEDVSDSSGSR